MKIIAVIFTSIQDNREKSTAENAVRHFERQIANALAGKAFPTLAALNAEIAGIVERVNAAPFANPRDIRGSRDRAFDEIDLPQMRALPGDPYTTCDYRSYLRVPDNYHLEYDGHYYSVSHTMRGKPAVLKATMAEVRLCDTDNRLLCVHRRAWEKFPFYVTDASHMPEAHRFAKEANERDGAYYRRWAAAIGPNTAQVIDRILRAPRHEQQAYRSCAGLLHASKGVPLSSGRRGRRRGHSLKDVHVYAVRTHALLKGKGRARRGRQASRAWEYSREGSVAMRGPETIDEAIVIERLRSMRLSSMAEARDAGKELDYLRKLSKLDLLAIDDFGLMDLDLDRCRDTIEVIDSREGPLSTMVLPQFPVSSWFDMFSDSTYADARLSRLTDKRNAYRLEMNGKSMREAS